MEKGHAFLGLCRLLRLNPQVSHTTCLMASAKLHCLPRYLPNVELQSLLPRHLHCDKGLFSSNSDVPVSQLPAEIKQGIRRQRCCNTSMCSVRACQCCRLATNNRMVHWVRMVLDRLYHISFHNIPFQGHSFFLQH